MRSYILKRVLLMIPTLFVVTIIIFGSIRLIPGSIIDSIVEQQEAVTQVDREQIEQKLGLDLPIHIQYGKWVGNIILHNDFGRSLLYNTPVIDQITDRLPVSLELGLMGILISLVISIPLGVYSAIRQDSLSDYAGRSVAITLVAIPNFWIALLVVKLPAIWWNWSPSLRYIPFAEDPVGNLIQFVIPATLLGMQLGGGTMRMMRTMMLEILRQDYIRTAWSKGLKERTVITRHALKNAFIPIITMIGFQIPLAISGSVILEKIFALPGVGYLLIDSLSNRDYTTLSGINLFVAVAILVINLIVDLTYARLDPRIHYR